LMAFRDYPFDERGGGRAEWPRFPHHSHVLSYLESFARHFDLEPLITCGTQVRDIDPQANSWRLSLDSKGKSTIDEFDAVAVCSGHFSKPRVPALPGMSQFGGMQLHSHNYRRPEDYAGQVVAVLGVGASGADIVQEISRHAEHILWCGFPDIDEQSGVVRRLPLPEKVTSNGLSFASLNVRVDTLVYCTGYHYDLPFLGSDLLEITDNHVAPLYRDILPPAWPTLGLIGLPFLVVPFPLYAMQASWFAATLDGKVKLPDASEMLLATVSEANLLLESGVKRRHLHRLGDRQEAYYNVLARECGEPELGPEFGELAKAAQAARQRNPASFRDEPLISTLPSL
jgi:hypothetical protein